MHEGSWEVVYVCGVKEISIVFVKIIVSVGFLILFFPFETRYR